MGHNKIFRDIVQYAKINKLKTDTLYHFVVDQETNEMTPIEDTDMVMEEFSELLDTDSMTEHVCSVLKRAKIPFDNVKYAMGYACCKLVIPFQFQDTDVVDISCIECFFGFEIHEGDKSS